MTTESTLNERDAVHEVARRGRVAAAHLRQLTRNEKDAALHAIADALVARTPEIVTANAVDIDRARSNGTSDAARGSSDEGDWPLCEANGLRALHIT